MQNKQFPQGEMVLRTLAMPANTNAHGDIFGGWIMSQMDMGGAILAKEIAKGRVVTVSVNDMVFFKPVNIGDIVACYAKCIRVGNSSITIHIEIWIKKVTSQPIGHFYQATKAIFIYVAINEYGKPKTLC
ncbi:Acyl-CoA thioester hydrolase YciA [Buchnera aphidicola (Eriosoma lanigerum)]|uniref:acyl-CoA thioester hydrolase YciA n=1 Tax=Buchnera aphidicola TaxID=9 RepID=UPI0034638C33